MGVFRSGDPCLTMMLHAHKAEVSPRLQRYTTLTVTAKTNANHSGRSNWLPWASCNLRRNPFGELTRSERAEISVVDVGEMARLVADGVAIQLVGDCGRGKTTRMLALLRHFPNSTYAYLPEDGPCPVIARGCPTLIDEAQRMSRSVRRAVFSQRPALVLATHCDLSRKLRRFGYQVHTRHIGDDNTCELVHQIMNRRIAASRLAKGPVPTFPRSVASSLVQRFGSNIRAMESHLYEQVQIQVMQHGEMRFDD